jgi:quercetin dioxygenase-like cupin family protein
MRGWRDPAAMQITRSTSAATTQGPADWFTGTVFIDTIAAPVAPARAAAAIVHFAPGARTAWHTHPYGQTIHVTEGEGRCQRQDGPVETIRPGDSVLFEPGENHWHGASPGRFMVHVAIHEVNETGSPVTWGRHVSDAEYSAGQPDD